MKKTGTILKEAREKKGISIYEVSTATKINTKNLMAMEEGAIERLPPKTFLRGFVASYATYLQIDTNEVLKVFFEEMGSTRPEVAVRDQVTGELQKGDDARDSSRTDMSVIAALTDNKKIGYFKIYGIVAILILIVIIGVIKRKMDSYESESIPQSTIVAEIKMPTDAGKPDTTAAVVAATPNAQTSPSPTPAQSLTPTATATPAPTPMATATPKPNPTITPTPTPSSTPVSTPRLTPTPANSPAAKSTPDMAANKSKPGTSPTPTASPSPAPGRNQEVIIEALNDVEVVVQIDSEPARKMTLHHDEVQSIKARRKVSMKFSDGGAINLTVNGKDKGVPGDLGKPKKLDIP